MPPNHKPIAVLLADDHAGARTVREFLEGSADSRHRRGSGRRRSLQDLLTQRLPDVAVLDVRTARSAASISPNASKATYPQVRVLMLTACDDDPYVLAALRAGPTAFCSR
ncbi:MAG: hypothetical protein R2873_26800 [Caldilineaceae bacterium]